MARRAVHARGVLSLHCKGRARAHRASGRSMGQEAEKAFEDADSDRTSDSDEPDGRTRPTMEFVDLGGGADESMHAEDGDVAPSEASNFPLHDISKTIIIVMSATG